MPINKEEQQKKEREETQEDLDFTDDKIHPEVVFRPFKYISGKPDRVKKVTHFISHEEEKILMSQIKALEKDK